MKRGYSPFALFSKSFSVVCKRREDLASSRCPVYQSNDEEPEQGILHHPFAQGAQGEHLKHHDKARQIPGNRTDHRGIDDGHHAFCHKFFPCW